MMNFTYCNPTNIVFGRGSMGSLADLVKDYKKILFMYGKGSIKRNGIYQNVKTALAKKTIFEYGDVAPNPSYSHLVGAIELAKKEKVDFILAVGGGSVIDAAKFVAAAVSSGLSKEYWDIITKPIAVEAALPVGAILTLAATGSENNGNSVISNYELGQKRALASPLLFPKFAILDPEFLMSLPKKQITNGIADAFTHIVEQYLTYNIGGDEVQERQAEALLLALIDISDRLTLDAPDYDTFSSFMWCASLALNMLIGRGVPQDWSTHMIGHEITAKYGLDHAESLMIVLPAVLRYKREAKKEKLVKFARRVWGSKLQSDYELSEYAIEAVVDFFRKIGGKTTLAEYGINPLEIAAIAKETFEKRGSALGERGDILPNDVSNILKTC